MRSVGRGPARRFLHGRQFGHSTSFLAIYSSDRCSASSRVPTAVFIPARASWPHDLKKLRCTLFRRWALRGRSAIDDPISGLKRQARCYGSKRRPPLSRSLLSSVNYKTRLMPFGFWQMVGHTRWPHCCRTRIEQQCCRVTKGGLSLSR